MNLILRVLLLFTVPFSVTMAALPKEQGILGEPLAHPVFTEKEGSDPVTILFTGDMMLGRYIATLRERNGGDFPFTYMPDVIAAVEAELEVEELDLVVGNLEGPIVEDQIAYGDMVFRFAPEIAPLLKKVGFTTVSLANNHSVNQSFAGLDETRSHLSAAGVDNFGHPNTSDGEHSFLRYEYPNLSIGFLGLNHTDFKLDLPSTLEVIKRHNEEVDFLVIGIHWGAEYLKIAPDTIQDMGHQFVDAGADMIWGHHPHVVQNSEIYNDAPIYYSLGNFVFDQYWSQPTQEGLVLGVKLENGEVTVKEVWVDLVNMGEPKPRAKEEIVIQ